MVAKCIGKSVLHLGAVDYYEDKYCGLHRTLTEVADYIVGIDIDKNGIEHAKLEGIQNILWGDLEKLHDVDIAGEFDVIVAGEVIEHLSNTGLFLQGTKRFFGTHTEMIITTPNAFSFHRSLLSLGRLELVHPDHKCYYSYTTLRHLLKSHGFAIQEESAYVLEEPFRNLRELFGKVNFNFANGLVFTVKI